PSEPAPAEPTAPSSSPPGNREPEDQAERTSQAIAAPPTPADHLYPSIGNIIIRQTGQGWEFRPSTALAQMKGAAFGAVAGGALLLAGCLLAAGGGNPVIMVLAAAGALGGAGPALVFVVRTWRQGETPLVIEDHGLVRYGSRELCPPGAGRAL